MTYEMQIHIPLEHALTNMWMGLVKKWSKILRKMQWVSQKVCGLGLLSLQINSISVCVRLLAPFEKWEVETLFIAFRGSKIRDHVTHPGRMITRSWE